MELELQPTACDIEHEKELFLAYSSNEDDLIVKELLHKMFDFEFIEHESYCIGNYSTEALINEKFQVINYLMARCKLMK